jgi:hypothetical protein
VGSPAPSRAEAFRARHAAASGVSSLVLPGASGCAPRDRRSLCLILTSEGPPRDPGKSRACPAIYLHVGWLEGVPNPRPSTPVSATYPRSFGTPLPSTPSLLMLPGSHPSRTSASCLQPPGSARAVLSSSNSATQTAGPGAGSVHSTSNP